MPTIEVELPDGSVVEFPEGTDNATMERALSQYSAAPDFSGVRSEFRAAPRREPERLSDTLPGGLSRLTAQGIEDFGRAAIHHAGSALHGGAQAIQHGTAAIADRVLPEEMAARIRAQVADDDEALRRREAEYQAQAPDSFAANAGAVTGAVAPFLLSGGRLGGNIVSGAVGRYSPALGRVLGGATEGAVGAATTPVLEGDFAEEKIAQVGPGAVIGGALPLVGQAVGALKPLSDYASRFTEGGAIKRASEQIRDAVGGNIGRLAGQASRVSGSRRTLAQETLDADVAKLEDLTRTTHPGGFAAMEDANNRARLESLRTFAGTPDEIAAADRARDAAADPLRKAAMKEVGVDTSRLIGQLDRGIDKLNGRPAVQAALRDVRELLFRPATAAEKAASPNWPDMVPIDDVATLYNVRKTIGDLLSGKAGGDKSYAKAATRELIGVRDALDRAIGKTSPEFGQYLDTFREGARQVGRMEIGRELIEGGPGAWKTDTFGNPILTPAGFSRQAANLDRVAQKATGFRKASADRVLDPEDMAAIRDVRDDLNRVARAGELGAGRGSPTFGREELESRLAAQLIGKVTFGLSDVLDKVGNTRVREQLAYLLQNPEAARAAVAKLPPKDAAILADVLAKLSAAAGAASGQAAIPEVDVVGGLPAPRDEVARNIERYAR